MLNCKIEDLVEVEIGYTRDIKHGWIYNISDGIADIKIAEVVEDNNQRKFWTIKALANGDWSSSYDVRDKIIRSITPSEMIVDFGNGITGIIQRNVNYKNCVAIDVTNSKGIVATIFTEHITEPMKCLVLELIKEIEAKRL